MEQQTVKRWEFVTIEAHGNLGTSAMCHHDDGHWVEFKDYATLERRVRELERKALAYDNIAERGQECWDYCQQHADGRFGRNIWHIVLEDALRFRSLPAPPSQEGR